MEQEQEQKQDIVWYTIPLTVLCKLCPAVDAVCSLYDKPYIDCVMVRFNNRTYLIDIIFAKDGKPLTMSDIHILNSDIRFDRLRYKLENNFRLINYIDKNMNELNDYIEQ